MSAQLRKPCLREARRDKWESTVNKDKLTIPNHSHTSHFPKAIAPSEPRCLDIYVYEMFRPSGLISRGFAPFPRDAENSRAAWQNLSRAFLACCRCHFPRTFLQVKLRLSNACVICSSPSLMYLCPEGTGSAWGYSNILQSDNTSNTFI